jgi:hypothetical protein
MPSQSWSGGSQPRSGIASSSQVAELNEGIEELLERLNGQPFCKREGTRGFFV